jgi:hypothetical protein
MPKKRVIKAPAPSKAPEVTPGPSAGKGMKHKPTAISQLPETLWKLAVKYRWQETPVVAVALVFWAGSGAGFGAALTALSAALLYFSRTKGAIGGRMWLSERERQTAALWLALASAWQLFVLLPIPARPGLADLAILVAMVALPSVQWWGSRRPPRPKRISAKSTERLARWSLKVAVKDGTLKGSRIDRATVREPAPEVLSFEVELREDVHNADAANETSRKAIESGLGLPADCATVSAMRNKSSRISVVIAPARNLETKIVTWPLADQLISPEGILPISRTDNQETIAIQKWGKDGIKHGRGCGNSGTGKSGVLRCLALPGVEARIEVAWLIDGKRGTSVPEIADIFDWYSVDDREWLSVLLTLEAIVKDRQKRRGKERKSAWKTGTEADPNIALYVEECGEVAKVVGKRGAKAMLTILQQGRALGVSVYQTGQDPMADFIIGGRPARDLLAMGFEILGKPGGKLTRNLAQDSNDSTTKVNLLALPAGEGLEGFVAVLQGGKVLATKSRVAFFDDETARARADLIVERGLRTLAGADLIAGGAAYAKRNAETYEPLVYTEELAEELGDEDACEAAQTEEEISAVQSWILKVLSVNKAGLTLGELAEKGSGQRGRSRRNISINLGTLKAAEKVSVEGDTWKRFDP